jgi:hypothetical protein
MYPRTHVCNTPFRLTALQSSTASTGLPLRRTKRGADLTAERGVEADYSWTSRHSLVPLRSRYCNDYGIIVVMSMSGRVPSGKLLGTVSPGVPTDESVGTELARVVIGHDTAERLAMQVPLSNNNTTRRSLSFSADRLKPSAVI